MIVRSIARKCARLTEQTIYQFRRPRSGKPYKLTPQQQLYFERLAFPEKEHTVRLLKKAIKFRQSDITDAQYDLLEPGLTSTMRYAKKEAKENAKKRVFQFFLFFQIFLLYEVFKFQLKREKNNGTSKSSKDGKEANHLQSLDAIKSIEIETKYYLHWKDHFVTVYLKDGSSNHYQIANPNNFLEQLQQAQRELLPNTPPIPVSYKPIKEFPYLTALSTALDISWMTAILVIMWKNRRGINIEKMLFGKSNRKVHSVKDITVRFDDVAGMEQAKVEVTEFVDFLKNNRKFKEMGAKIPRGALLTGPPGTGKTMLAKAIAGESGVPFFYIAGSEFVEMFGGLGAARVRDLFSDAKSQAPSIIFIDEIDTIGKKREGLSNEEKDSTLNQLLVEMDGFKTDKGVIVLAATNRKDVLDSALTRPGRFDRIIEVDLPDITGRTEIFRVHLKPIKLNPSKTLEEFAKRLATLTPGFSGADIANLCNEAAILAARRLSKFVEPKDFEIATERVMAGLEKRNLMTPEVKKVVAYHEAGHAVTAWFLEGGDPLVKVTIIPRSKGSLGYAQYLPNEAVALKTKQQLMDKIVTILGGRISEEHFFGKVTTGAADDLQKVFRIARAMVTQFGMSNVIGYVGFEQEGFINKYSEKTAANIDHEIMKIVKEAEDRCRVLIKEKEKYIEELAKLLIQKQTLNTSEIAQVLGKRPFETDQHKKYLQMASS